MVSNIDKYYQGHIIYDSKRELAGRGGCLENDSFHYES